jgi:drug/metabolite transporter (DMT)-like permease
MTWQLCIFIFLTLSVVAGLFQRKLGRDIPQYSSLVNALFFLCVHYPAGLIVASVLGFDATIGWVNLAVIAAFSITFPLAGLLSLRASKDVDAGLFSIVQNLGPVVSIILAVLLLSERLNIQQLVGTLIIVASALSISTLSYSRGSKSTKKSIILAITTVGLVGVGVVYEAWMLQRIGFSNYLVYGWGFQTFWAVVFAWPMLPQAKNILKSPYRMPVLIFSLTRSMKGGAFVGALYLSSSASLISAFVSFLPVLMVVAGFIFLRETQYLKLKIASAFAGSIGLLILTISR